MKFILTTKSKESSTSTTYIITNKNKVICLK